MRRTLLVVLMLLGFADAAFADVTGFVGVRGKPYLGQNSSTLTWGVALDRDFFTTVKDATLAWEIEYADTGRPEGDPGYRTFMLGMLAQSPRLGPARIYGGMGGGVYSRQFEPAPGRGLGLNASAGVKLSIIGPFGVRADYRAFFLRREFKATFHRIYAGANFEF